VRRPALLFRDDTGVDAAGARAVVLVEGASDRSALEALAARTGRDLPEEGVAVLAIGGAQAIRRSLELYGPRGLDLRLAGLCDAGEEEHFRRALELAGLDPGPTRKGL
jgi:OLD-like protein